jgi:Protein of unknown function (DUF3306)
MSKNESSRAEDAESFLARWSRRKLAPAERPDPVPATRSAVGEHGQPATADAASPHAEPPELPALDSLDGLKSEYQAFMQREVGETTRRNALKKLFSDPHFNIMDGLDTYIDDYSIEDPVPEAMLRGLNQARSLLLFEERDDGAPNAGQSGAAKQDTQCEASPTADPAVVPTVASPPTDSTAGEPAPAPGLVAPQRTE